MNKDYIDRFIHIDECDGGIDWLGFNPTGNYSLDNYIGHLIADALIEDLKKTGSDAPLIQTLLRISDLGTADYRGVLVGLGYRLAGALLG